MTLRAALHTLLDHLPEDALPAVARYLEAVLAGCPPEAPFDDEPLSPEEAAALANARAEIARSETVRHEELGERLTAHPERP